MDFSNGPNIYCLQETHFGSKDTNNLKVKKWKMTFHANGNEKRADVAVLTDKIDFKFKKKMITGRKKYINIKRFSIASRRLTSIHAPNDRPSK